MIEDQLKALVLECLKKPRTYDPGQDPFQVSFLFQEVAEIAKARQLKLSTGRDGWLGDGREVAPCLRVPITDLVWDLIIEGILRPGSETDPEKGYPCIHLTRYGKQILKNPTTPHDPDNFMKQLKADRPDLDEVILTYMRESADALCHSLMLSSTFMLGAACEKAFLLLADALSNALNLTDSVEFDKEFVKARFVKRQHELFMEWFKRKVEPRLRDKKVKGDWLTKTKNSLAFMFEYFRDARNDVGHPESAAFSREEVEQHLVLFRSYVSQLYELMDEIKSLHPI